MRSPKSKASSSPSGDFAPEVVVSVRSEMQERVYQALRTKLLEGALSPGETIVVRDVAEAMSVSSTPVREAIHRLIGNGALEPMPNGNSRVRLFSEKQLDEWWSLRTLLESIAMERAAERVTAEMLDPIRQVNAAMSAALDCGNVPAIGRLNREFHFKCYELAGSVILSETIESLWEKAGPYIVMPIPGFLRAYASGQPKTLTVPHHEMLAALENKDTPAAAAALRRDIGMTLKWKQSPEAILIQMAVTAVMNVRKEFRLVRLSPIEARRGQSRADVFQRPHSLVTSIQRSKRRSTAQSRAYNAIREVLIGGAFVPGEQITVRSLCERLRIGSMPVREALQKVTSEGALEKLGNGRLRVRLLSDADRNDLVELRSLLESIAAALAATQIKAPKIEQLRNLHKKTTAAVRSGDQFKIRVASHAFVEALSKAANFDVLVEVLERVWTMIGPSTVLYRQDLNNLPECQAKIIDSLVARAPYQAACNVAGLSPAGPGSRQSAVPLALETAGLG